MAAITDVTWPVQSPTTVLKTIPAYPYIQYQDDDNITCFFDAFNIYAQAYVDYMNSLDLPIYTKAPVQGALLDWVAQGLYGISRPGLPISEGSPARGPVNTFTPNSLPVNGFVRGNADDYISVNDDFFRRILTWNLYRGDGEFVSPVWLKRRINRFLYGVDGQDIINNTTFYISIQPTDVRKWTIIIPTGTASQIFKSAVEANVIELPFQIEWTIVLNSSGELPFVFDAVGTGLTQTFSLPYAIISPQSIIVNINGLRQDTTDYTVSGTGLTMVADVGSSIEVVGPTGNAPTPWLVTGVTAVPTATFTLPDTGLTNPAVLVYVNGLRSNVSEYTISGTTLTLTCDTADLSVQIVPL